MIKEEINTISNFFFFFILCLCFVNIMFNVTEACSWKRWVTEHSINLEASARAIDIPFKYPFKFLMGTKANALIVFDVLIVVAFVFHIMNSIFSYFFHLFDSGGKEVYPIPNNNMKNDNDYDGNCRTDDSYRIEISIWTNKQSEP